MTNAPETSAPARKPLPSPLPTPPVDEELVSALAQETRLPSALVRAWLEGARRVSGETRAALLRALWAPLGGIR
ncbi:MAG TPA: hypothetical protein VK550_11135 [Polyangiaceae bacterium]|nr:hypothetical protein [Polyangiaceae bacterium]